MKKLITTIAFIALSTVSAKAIDMEMFSITGGLAANQSVFGGTAQQDEYNAVGTQLMLATKKVVYLQRVLVHSLLNLE